MPRTPITWQPIREPNLYGQRATVGERGAEVVRAYDCVWYWFPFLNGKQVVTGTAPESLSKADAVRLAVNYLNGHR